MSPPPIRRYRAERLLHEGFEHLRKGVLAAVSARLRAAGARLDSSDLDAAYSQAWQGLYAAVLEGQEIDNPAGWLALVTYRRAIDEHRASERARRLALESTGEGLRGTPRSTRRGPAFGERMGWQERDLAADLDDRTKLRHLFEALRGRLSMREQQAATLCYLQGLSRAEAAAQMGVSEGRMRKLMEGRGRGLLGVAGKLGALVETIGAGRWCEEQGSLMRGFAYGILDPGGERHRLASIHQSECPACRAYVLSLRGLAAGLPPLPSLLHLALGAGAGGTVAGGVGAGSGATAGATAGTGAGAGALSASGAAGAAGGGWWLAGPLAGKLAVGCALALGVGLGCIALDPHAPNGDSAAHRHRHSRASVAARDTDQPKAVPAAPDAHGALLRSGAPASGSAASESQADASVAKSAKAVREFGPEQSATAGDARSGAIEGRASASAHAASASASRAAVPSSGAGARAAGASSESNDSPGAVPAAQREFAPG
jgi:DNA-directed RNA polymerase specialized sigma24 family protein